MLARSSFTTLALALALALAFAFACSSHDTIVATYRVQLPDGGTSSGGSAGGPTTGMAGATGGVAGASAEAGAGGEAGAPPGPACLLTYTGSLEGSTSRYKVVMTGDVWVAAQRDCEAEGAHLIVIDDDAENDWMQSIAELSVTDSASTNQLSWLGLGDHAAEGEFRWITGAPLDTGRWAADEPNSLRNYEDCVEIRASGTWNDDRCNARLSYVCECDGAAAAADAWCDTDQAETCGDCSTACSPEQTCNVQLCE